MNRLTKVLSQNKENNIKSLVAYLVAGDPCEESTLELLNGFAMSGVDVIEVGVPFQIQLLKVQLFSLLMIDH